MAYAGRECIGFLGLLFASKWLWVMRVVGYIKALGSEKWGIYSNWEWGCLGYLDNKQWKSSWVVPKLELARAVWFCYVLNSAVIFCCKLERRKHATNFLSLQVITKNNLEILKKSFRDTIFCQDFKCEYTRIFLWKSRHPVCFINV